MRKERKLLELRLREKEQAGPISSIVALTRIVLG